LPAYRLSLGQTTPLNQFQPLEEPRRRLVSISLIPSGKVTILGLKMLGKGVNMGFFCILHLDIPGFHKVGIVLLSLLIHK
jgi:hypothetical protein